MNSPRFTASLVVSALVAALWLGTVARSAPAAEDMWQTNFKSALTKAKAEKKYVLVDFTGSTWCVWCKRLHAEVLDKDAFKAAAPKQFVLVSLDYPQEIAEAPEELKKLAEKYKIEGFPTVLLMDAEGQVIARTGYRDGGPEKYLDHLADFNKIYGNVLALKQQLAAAKGVERAKMLDQLIEDYEKLNNDADEIGDWSKEIIALDVGNKAGLKVKYEFRQAVAEAEELRKAGKVAEARDKLEKALALQGVSGDLRQIGYLHLFECHMNEQHFAQAIAALQHAKEADPKSKEVAMVDSLIEQYGKLAVAEEAVNKLAADLATAKGLDRAKLLDKLITAKQQLPMTADASEDVQKWTKEIIALDSDNKAGLKKRYQFQSALADAVALARGGKADQANAALDKILEMPDVAGEDAQKVLFLKAQIALASRNATEATSYIKKALAAAPKSTAAPMLTQLLDQLDKASKATKSDDK